MEIKTTGEIIDKWDEIEEITEESKWVSLESLNKQIRELDPNNNSVGFARLYARLNIK